MGGEVFQLASGVETSFNTLISLLVEISGCEPEVRREPPRRGEILRNYSLVEKAKHRLGYAPEVSLRQGLELTYAWFVETMGAAEGLEASSTHP